MSQNSRHENAVFGVKNSTIFKIQEKLKSMRVFILFPEI